MSRRSLLFFGIFAFFALFLGTFADERMKVESSRPASRSPVSKMLTGALFGCTYGCMILIVMPVIGYTFHGPTPGSIAAAIGLRGSTVAITGVVGFATYCAISALFDEYAHQLLSLFISPAFVSIPRANTIIIM
ncbi:hypothetical protein PAPYR_13306 [Paratrimastix pyriformis]|uniref:Uncharacterized protein n=1 Tax=Paratrimastix pyriformis TaxID=342808 RepID=A0ABQ8U2M8_9EUKA|nr:hypothetical protein PAPYR_13306 [Paratrimastix pyriformis]